MDWNLDPSQFGDDFNTTPLNKAMLTILNTGLETIQEMKTELEIGENRQFGNRLEYVMNIFSKLSMLNEVENDPSYTDKDIEDLIADVEEKCQAIDFNKLFGFSDDTKSGIDVIDYLPDANDGDGDFDF